MKKDLQVDAMHNKKTASLTILPISPSAFTSHAD
jgi:hypothetical protein